MAEDTKENNVVDFVPYKLRHMEAISADHGNFDYATALHTALKAYLDGTIDIMFSGGYPYTVHRDPPLHADQQADAQADVPNATDDIDS